MVISPHFSSLALPNDGRELGLLVRESPTGVEGLAALPQAYTCARLFGFKSWQA